MSPFLLARRSYSGYSRDFIINSIRLFWITLIILRETGSFFWSLSSCTWPDHQLAAAGDEPVHVLLVADSQARLEPFGSRPLGLTLYDSFLRRAWHVTMRLKPHIVIFLGDMLSPGVTVARDEYNSYFTKHQKLFPVDVPSFYLPGNNDIGLGQSSSTLKQLRRSYSKTFGHLNQRLSVKNHTLVLLDSPGLVGEDYARAAKGVDFPSWKPLAGGPTEFVRSLTKESPNEPTILLSHIPLFRPDSASCGPLREKGNIRRGVGPGYQNTLGKQTTSYLLNELMPAAIFSADNRDYCEYIHHILEKSENISVREVTVKSFSQARHIMNPGFQLLSISTPLDLVPASEQRSFTDQLCTLPNVSISYTTIYWPLAAITFLVLFYINTLRNKRSRFVSPATSTLSRQSSRSPLHSPLLQPQPDSAVWSPYTPITTSPKSSFPSTLRTPNIHTSSTSTLQAFARSATPKGSPLLTAMRFPVDNEDLDTYPSQYANHALDNTHHDHGEDEDSPPVLFLEPPPHLLKRRDKSSWSWSFVLRGRRRQLTIHPPTMSWADCTRLSLDLISIRLGASQPPPTRSMLALTVLDSFAVIWPALLAWVAIVWWVF